MMKKLTLLLIGTLSGCGVTFNPDLGISLKDWQSLCMSENWSKGHLVAAEGNNAVYYCDNTNVQHHFENGRLVKVINAPTVNRSGVDVTIQK